jgi:chromosome segregation ATPase
MSSATTLQTQAQPTAPRGATQWSNSRVSMPDALLAKITTLEGEITALNAKIIDLEFNNASLTEEKQIFHEEPPGLEKLALKHRVSILETQNIKLLKQNIQLWDAIKQLHQRNGSLRSNFETQNRNLFQQNIQLSDTIKRMHKQNQALHSDNLQLKTSVNELAEWLTTQRLRLREVHITNRAPQHVYRS